MRAQLTYPLFLALTFGLSSCTKGYGPTSASLALKERSRLLTDAYGNRCEITGYLIQPLVIETEDGILFELHLIYQDCKIKEVIEMTPYMEGLWGIKR
jgi:hypothetical protein